MVGGGAAARGGEEIARGLIAKAAKSALRDAERAEVKVGARDVLGKSAKEFDESLTKDLSASVRDGLGKTFDDAHPGPLRPDQASTFKDGKYTVGMTDETRRFMRAGDAQATNGNPHLGQFWSDTRPQSVETVRRDMAVLPEWPGGGKSPLNTGYDVAFPPGTVFYYGEVADQGGKYVGGGMQYLIQAPWMSEPKPLLLDSWPLKP